MSSESSMSEDSDSSYGDDDKEWTRQIIKKRKKGPGVFQSVYQSDEEEAEDSKGTKLSGKGKVVKPNDYPSIFKKESDDSNEDEEDWYINYEQRSQFQDQFRDNFVEDEPSTFSCCLKSSRKRELENTDLYPTSPADEYALCDDLAKPSDGPGSTEDELPEPDEIIDATENVGDLGEAFSCGKNPVIIDSESTSILERFEGWLKGLDGGKKDEQCARQCMRQIQLIVVTIDPDKPKIVNLLDKIILRDKWLMKFEKDRKPGTIKAYLGALDRFYAFLKCERIQFPGALNVSEILGSMIEQMKMWSKTYNKQVKERFWEKRMEDISCLRTPEQIQQFDVSDLPRVSKFLANFKKLQKMRCHVKKNILLFVTIYLPCYA